MWPFHAKPKARALTAIQLAAIKRIEARLDAAQTTAENARHWSNADSLSADAAYSPDVRATVRNRARYEAINNSYARGIVTMVASDTIGLGPNLQVRLKDNDLNNALEAAWKDWAAEIRLAEKLRTMRIAKMVDGEAFAQLVTNPRLDSPVKLDLAPIEADRVAAPLASALREGGPANIDGIELDTSRNPVVYTVAKEHPGGNSMRATEFRRVPARHMIHWFRADRPEQHRGISELASALPLFAQLRRYTLAVLAAAEVAADLALVLQADAGPDGPAEGTPFEVIELERRLATVLPMGYKIGGFKGEQPVTGYREFTTQIIGEIARCINMPLNLAMGCFNDASYASGRMDDQMYFRPIHVERGHCDATVIARLWSAWCDEASRLENFEALRGLPPPPRELFWQGTEHVDPKKVADAQAIKLRSGTTTYAVEYAREGKDWETEFEQLQKERTKLRALGLDDLIPGAAPPATPTHEDETDDIEEEMEETARRARAAAAAIHRRLGRGRTGGGNGRH